MGTGFDESYSSIMTNEDFVRAMELQGIEFVPEAGMTTFTVFGPFEVVAPEVKPKSDPAFGVHLREAWHSLKKLWRK